MSAILEQWLILLSTPLYAIIIGLEILLSHLHNRNSYSFRDSAASVYLLLLNSGIDLGFRVVYLAALHYFFVHAIAHIHPSFLYWTVLLLLEDFLYYWLHRFDHRIRLFWAVHVTHHSSERMNFTVGFRSSVFQPLYRFMYFIPLALLGFQPLDIAFIYSLTQIWGIFVHTELVGKMGVLEYFMVTPSHHRVHHGSNPRYLDRNMGMFLIIWDKLFGTFQEELSAENYQPIRYGLTKNIENPTAVSVIFHEWSQLWKDITQKGLPFKTRLQYLFGAPGWSHDGSRFTSEQMRLREAIGTEPSGQEGFPPFAADTGYALEPAPVNPY
ncbi:sterol desaturase family protein [Sediminibacterium soli]|uniref:sterol desaturase family protein n=1 Tax=Sediminibacterium soli TaxID=2698829 RepID=UPI00137B50EC|nr:sterol desaturase family protein [Sediminibacterium soli]NCI45960.1 sterol desaturase family protein [Sediminibacterium soli]